jgi:kynureninase
MPRGARAALERDAAEWDGRGVRAWNEGWWELPVAMGDLVAAFLGAPAGSVAMQPNVTLATALLLSAFDFSAPRNRLVTDALNFPSLLYLFEAMGAPLPVAAGGLGGIPGREGARPAALPWGGSLELVVVPSEDGITIEAGRLLEAIDERTRVVAVSQVLFRSSFVHDVPAIALRAREAGAAVLLDVYQSAGILPVHLGELGVEAAVGGCLKWLCGGPGAAFLYVRPDLGDRLCPRLTGWQAHADPFSFAAPPIRRSAGAWRFLHGTPAVPALRAAEAGLRIISGLGAAAIREQSLGQTRLLLERAGREGWTVRTPKEEARRGGVVTIDPPHAYEVSRELLARGILVDYRSGSGIRLGPHVYNTDEEILGACDAVAGILEEGSWRRHRGRERDTVT